MADEHLGHRDGSGRAESPNGERSTVNLDAPYRSDMALDEQTRRRLASIRTIDLTTIGRRSGRPSRIEIWWFYFEDRFIVSGTPGPRHWMANIADDPTVIIHAGGDDHVGTAIVIDDRDFRHSFFTHPDPEIGWYSTQAQLEVLIDTAPMIEIRF